MQKKHGQDLSVNCAACYTSDLHALNKLAPVQDAFLHAYEIPAYQTPYSFIKLPSDQAYINVVKTCACQKQQLSCTVVVFIGIGGSSLGAQAIYQSLCGDYWNLLHTPKVYFADSLDPYEAHYIVHLVEHELKNKNHVLCVMISKTGTTLESVAHFAVFSSLLKRYYPLDYREYIVIISDEHSVLADHARKNNYAFLPIPAPSGGRYSVFTAVGLFALAFIGIDIKQLCLGAASFVDYTCNSVLDQNNAALSALSIYQHYEQHAIILDYFTFLQTCRGIGAWYRQLIGESLGKIRANDTLCKLLPTVSVGSQDLHAVAQLYLGGLPPMVTQFLTCSTYSRDVLIDRGEVGADLSRFSYGQLMQILFDVTKQSYDDLKRPYIHIQIPELTAFYVGRLLQFHMIQVVYLGALLDVNQFDQPQVELYKKYVQKRIS
jgi:glucose-6-phosphate isomerase